jgi:F-type H+-transporting ATPase subunit b
MFLAVDLAGTVKSAIENGVILIENGEVNVDKLPIALITLIAQLVATTVLFLVVRFKFWNVVTSFIDARKNAVQAELDKAENAKIEVEQATIESKELVQNARTTANNIIQQAKTLSEKEAEEILNDAHDKIESDKEKALREIDQKEIELRRNIQQEIVDVAYLLADKMVNKQMDEKHNQLIVDEFLNSDGTINDSN